MISKIIYALCIMALGTIAAPCSLSLPGYAAPDGTAFEWTVEAQRDLVAALEGLRAHGLDPQHYEVGALTDRTGQGVLAPGLASRAWITAAADMRDGRAGPDREHGRETFDPVLAARLRTALDSRSLAASLEELAPAAPDYAVLKAELARLQSQFADPVVTVPLGPLLKAPMSGARVKTLQRRLVQLGLLAQDAVSGVMDPLTVDAVIAFQTRQALEPDGVVGPATLRALNRGLQDRIDQVRVNMDRLRWLPAAPDTPYLQANIASFQLTAFENGTPERRHRVIVGRTDRQTPIFSGEIEYIVLNPWWETPPRLARTDLLSRFRRDPGSVERLGFQVLDAAGHVVRPSSIDWSSLSSNAFPYRIRQAPGPSNALGQVKIIFPNPYSICMHDTPSRELFERVNRTFSSGCLRVDSALDIAAWLLARTGSWDRPAIDAVIESGKTLRIDLDAPVPIRIVYRTVIGDGEGGVQYLDDVYARDKGVLTRLEEPSPLLSAGMPGSKEIP